MRCYDAIVIGVGGVGSAAVYHLACRGLRTLGLEQFELLHRRGSSHGHTRVIRQAYFEHPDYVPLLKSAYQLWDALEVETQSALFHQIGLLEVGPPQGEVVSGVLAAARQHDLEVLQLTRESCQARFPALVIPDGSVGVFEPSAGYLKVEDCVRAHIDAAVHRGASVQPQEEVVSWSVKGLKVQVETRTNTYETERLVVCAGPWAQSVLRNADLNLEVRRKHVHWFPTKDTALRSNTCPIFLFEVPAGVFYGFPNIDNGGVKVAEHSGGATVTDPGAPLPDVDSHDLQRVSAFIKEHVPSLKAAPRTSERCLYTMSPDGHFVVDWLNDQPPVAIAAGLSGHGFKFTPILGKALAEMVTKKETDIPVGFLAKERLQS